MKRSDSRRKAWPTSRRDSRPEAVKARLSPIVEVTVAIGTCLVLWDGARLALAGELSAGTLIIFLLYLGKMYKPMRDLSKMTDTVSKATVGYERIQEVLEIESRVRDVRGARPAPKFKGQIEFSQVSFTYEGGKQTLKDVSFKIEAGQVAAIVGPSGTGKTTLVSLIPRFYDPVSGFVSIDGTDVRKYRLKSLREQISFVLQDTLLSAPGSGKHCLRQAQRHTARKSGARPNWPMRMNSSRNCPMATTRWSASAASPCPAVNASASRLRGRLFGTRRF